MLSDVGTSLRSVIVSALYLARVVQGRDQSEEAIVCSCTRKIESQVSPSYHPLEWSYKGKKNKSVGEVSALLYWSVWR
jgi:hypothetical protein